MLVKPLILALVTLWILPVSGQERRGADSVSLESVKERMETVQRLLEQNETGQATRQEQAEVVETLSALIEMAEQREKNSQASASAAAASQSQPGGATPSQTPGAQSGQTGGGSRGTDTAAQPQSRVGPQSPWSTLREKERDPVYSAIQEKFPPRYQQLIEQYYKSFQPKNR
jgi:hypothetical protein